MLALLTALTLCASPGSTLGSDEHLWLGLGALSTGFRHGGGQWGDGFITPVLEGARRWRGGFKLEGALMLAAPVVSGGAGFGVTAAARVGLMGARWFALLGPSVELSPQAEPRFQILPTAKVGWLSGGPWSVTAALFEHHALAPAEVSLGYGGFRLGYVAPLGVSAGADIPLGGSLFLAVRALAIAVGEARTYQLTVGTGLWSLPGEAHR